MIYVIAPNATHPSGGVSVAAKWIRALIEHGYDAMFITPKGDPSPYWLSFKVPSGGYQDVQDIPGNKVVHIWVDCLVQFPILQAEVFYYAQDCAQPQYVETVPGRFEAEYLPLLKQSKLITIGHHSHWYYLYRWGLRSHIVNNWVDTDVFKPGAKEPKTVCMIDHRDHFNEVIKFNLEAAGYTVHVARGSEKEVAEAMGKIRFFVSDVRGRSDGFELSEGFPMPIAESMACGCIPICRDTNGVREYILDRMNGLFYSDPAEIPKLLDLADRNQPWWDTGEAAYNTFQHKFTEENAWNQIAEALELK